MGKFPIETGNIVLILVGIILTALGPYFAYRTYLDIQKRLKKSSKIEAMQWGSFALNFVICGMLIFAGVLFVINNLRGNPLA